MAETVNGSNGAARPRAVVVGAGIVGTSCAFFLQDEGFAVTLLDPKGPAGGTSFGNAGIIHADAGTALATPELLRGLPGMLKGQLKRRGGEIRLRWPHLPGLAPWLLRFVREAARSEANTLALRALAERAGAAHDSLIQAAGLGELVVSNGWLKVARDDKALMAATARERRDWDRFGVSYDLLDAAAVRELEPALARGAGAGLLLRSDRSVTDPGAYTRKIAQAFQERGGEVRLEAASGFEAGGGRVRAVRTPGGDLGADVVVLAAGAFSLELARSAGLRLPLIAERGYHAMLDHPDPPLTRPVHLLDHGAVLAPMRDGTRLTLGVELAARDAPADERWARGMVEVARKLVPSLGAEPRSVWLGHRPSLPDGLPAIGLVPGRANLIAAFGHQHLGLTLGPLTGRIVAELARSREINAGAGFAEDEAPARFVEGAPAHLAGLDLRPYRPDRFANP